MYQNFSEISVEKISWKIFGNKTNADHKLVQYGVHVILCCKFNDMD